MSSDFSAAYAGCNTAFIFYQVLAAAVYTDAAWNEESVDTSTGDPQPLDLESAALTA